ncbi:hypothetical protein [Alkaliphilus metalliredigens]|uniref:hypothetical protein n=1 Tax=Alkaliphilus metalliredigens TaxID=208226 RepID=UPI0018DD80D6|nr:hypothetical protein [Alkaliphilus metalliredigens]
MLFILILMSISTFTYILFICYYIYPKCPYCHNHSIETHEHLYYDNFVCGYCGFSYRSYAAYYVLTPIPNQLALEISPMDDDDDDDEFDSWDDEP